MKSYVYFTILWKIQFSSHQLKFLAKQVKIWTFLHSDKGKFTHVFCWLLYKFQVPNKMYIGDKYKSWKDNLIIGEMHKLTFESTWDLLGK